MSKLRSIAKIGAAVANCSLILMMLLVTIDVIGRQFFNHPFTGMRELNSWLLALLIFAGLAQSWLAGTHISVDVIVDRFKPIVRERLKWVTTISGLIFAILLMWEGFQIVLRQASLGARGAEIGIVEWPVRLIVPLGCLLLVLVLIEPVLSFLRRITKRRGGS